MEELREFLEKIANGETLVDSETCHDDYAGGDIDDAYAKGMEDGEIELARQLLEAYFLKK